MAVRSFMTRHFVTIAPRYRGLRKLDVCMVRRVSLELQRLSRSTARLRLLDVGAGTRRYTEAVLRDVSERGSLHYHAVAYDAVREMLRARVAQPPGTGSIDGGIGLAESLPFAARSFDAVLSFNAVHHFDLEAFLAETARVLRPKGKLIIYTRTPEQNRRTIWGQHFPHFAKRETRLYSNSTLRAALDGNTKFESQELLEMPSRIHTNLPQLIHQARSRAYSTFLFYSPAEFERALGTFDTRVRSTFDDLSAITAQNDHTLIFATRVASDTGVSVAAPRSVRLDWPAERPIPPLALQSEVCSSELDPRTYEDEIRQQQCGEQPHGPSDLPGLAAQGLDDGVSD